MRAFKWKWPSIVVQFINVEKFLSKFIAWSYRLFCNFALENYSYVFANLAMGLPRFLGKTQRYNFIPLSNE